MTTMMIMYKSAADHAGQTSTATIRHAADESVPATAGGDIVPTGAGPQRTDNGNETV